MAEEKKPFAETKFGQFIQKATPVLGNVMQVVGDITGVDAVEKIGLLLKDKEQHDEQAATLLQEFEQKKVEFQLEFQKLEMDTLKEELADVQNARGREIDFMKQTGKRDWMHGVVVGVALLLYVCAWLFLAYGPTISPEKKDMLNIAVGQVFGFAGMAFSYYLGTTRQSRLKDQALMNK